MELEATQVASAAVPFIVAAVQAYGTQTLERIRDRAIETTSDASVDWGRRLLARLIGRDEARPVIEEAVLDLEKAPEDDDAAAALRLQIRKALAEDPNLLADLADLLTDATPASSSLSATNVNVTQYARSFGNSKQAIIGSGIQNITFGKHELSS